MFSPTCEEHFAYLSQVLSKLAATNLTIKPSECHGRSSVLGITGKKRQQGLSNMAGFMDTPCSLHTGWWCAQTAYPCRLKLTKKDKSWGSGKTRNTGLFCSTGVLVLPSGQELLVKNTALECRAKINQSGKEYPILYLSRKLGNAEAESLLVWLQLHSVHRPEFNQLIKSCFWRKWQASLLELDFSSKSISPPSTTKEVIMITQMDFSQQAEPAPAIPSYIHLKRGSVLLMRSFDSQTVWRVRESHIETSATLISRKFTQ